MYPATWHCSGTLVTTVLTEDCTVTSTVSATTTVEGRVRSYDPDTTMMLALMLAILSIMLWQYIFKPFVKQ